MLQRYLLAPLATLLLLAAAPRFAQAQTGGVGIGTTAPDASAALDIVSSSKGLLLPRVASAAAIVSPAPGLLVYQTDSPAGFYYNSGTAASANWLRLSPADNLGNHTAITNLGLNGNYLSNAPGNANGLRIDNAGNVGVGVAAPTQALDVQGGLLARSNNPISQQGAYLHWNRTGGDGEAWLLNQQGGGPGGIRFGAATKGNAVTEWARFESDGRLGLGTTGPAASAALDVSSTTKGFLPPRLSQTQRDIISSPAAGLVVYNSTTNKLNIWNGTTWTDAYTSQDLAPVVMATSTTFNYTGGVQTYIVPAGVTTLQVTAAGAQGGQGNSATAGRGATVQTTLAVTPGETLYLYVGGAGVYNVNSGTTLQGGGYNGGGNAAENGGTGGGASDIRRGGTALSNRVVVAGGGGGAFAHVSGVGGDGGSPIGGDGAKSPQSGATQAAGGRNGGSLGRGADSGYATAAGGGGYYGGGVYNVSGSSGGGGSSWANPTTTSGTSYAGGNRSGHGYISLVTVPGGGSSTAAISGNNVQIQQLTQAQRDALSSPTAGLLIYNLSTGRLNFYTGTAWVDFFPASENGTLATATQTFYATGNAQTYTVPAGVTALAVDAKGGAGGYYQFNNLTISEARGARVQATLPVTPGQVLTLYVGGEGGSYTSATATMAAAGGYNGGGNAGYSSGSGGGGGGGATDIRIGGTALSNRVLVAAGGGGVGGDGAAARGGAGGLPTGGAGGFTTGATGGAGASQSSGNALGVGGNAGSTTRGGGGGGGYYGGSAATGGTAATGGGGGGSSYVAASASNVQYSTPATGGGGTLTLTPLNRPAPVLDGSNISGTWSVSGDDVYRPIGNVGINTNYDLLLRDANAGVGWYGSTGTSKVFAAATGFDGPVLYGYSGGMLGTKDGGNNSVLTWTKANNVGIGTTSPTQTLDVNGGILARASGAISTQGAYLQWNRSGGGDGATWLLNQQGLGPGGIFFGKSDQSNNVTEWARFDSQGNLGIGTSSPIAKLHVSGSASATPSGSGTSYFYAQAPLQGPGVPNGSGARATAAYFTGGQLWVNDYIVAGALNTTSDRRIKHVIGLSDRTTDLALLNQLRITDYTYIDQHANTPGIIKKVIAQEVEQVLPTAVSHSTQALPNVYEKAAKLSHAQGQLTVTTAKPHELPAGGGRMRFYTPTNEVLDVDVTAVDAHTVRFASAEAYASGLFVYGKYVDDFRSVDYDALTTLNVSATQELARQVAALEAENAALKVRTTQAEAKAAQATAAVEIFEARLRRLEAGTAQAQR